jgi:hypothetical protein
VIIGNVGTLGRGMQVTVLGAPEDPAARGRKGVGGGRAGKGGGQRGQQASSSK